MKKYIIYITLTLSFMTTQSQTVADALLYSKDNLTGTARFSAMNGAFGALGGDFSAIYVNPAGSAIFSDNQASITASYLNTKNKSDYFGSKVSTSNTAFDISQAGGALVFINTNEKSAWRKFILALDYENTSNHDNTINTFGTNPNQSVDSYFLSYANPGLYGSSIIASEINRDNINVAYEYLPNTRYQQAYLGFNGGIIKNNTTDTYISNNDAGDFYQENYIESSGYNGKVAINFATQYKDKFYFGLNLNSHFTDYKKSTLFYEENDNTTNNLKKVQFENYSYTYGNGFSFQLGALAKITSSFRAGLSYESPTWYRLNDEKQEVLSTSGYGSPNARKVINPNFVLIFPTYRLQTPSKWTGSLAYVFGKSGLISLDYSIKDYGNISFAPKDSFFRPLNSAVKNQLRAAGELRIGGEYRIKEWSLRGGYRYEQSPYKNKKTLGDLAGFSSGFGYNFGTTRLDLSYSYSQRKSQESFFNQGFTAAPKINTENNNFAVTLVFEL